MTRQADVYAGDLDAPGGEGEAPTAGSYLFRISADATPDVLSRIAHPFNIANVPPQRVMLRADDAGGAKIEVLLRGIPPDLADRIARKLMQLLIVTRIEVDLLTQGRDDGLAPR